MGYVNNTSLEYCTRFDLKREHLRPRWHIYFLFIFVFLSIASLASCTDDTEYPDSPEGNFEALCQIIDEHYCFFEEKNINWQEITAKYRPRVNSDTRQLELFVICSEMLDELKDGHVNLSSRFDTSYYRNWWSDYPQDFDLRTLQQYYLDFDYSTTSGMIYKLMCEGRIGYIYYPSFASGVSETALDYIFAQFYDTEALIIDIRDNGGGILTNIDRFVGRFIEHEIPGGSITHKTGPAHDAFSAPYKFSYSPCKSGHIPYLNRPIVVLTNRSCYSAANAFVAVMKSLPNVTIIGARTGGGAGLPFTSELPNGWGIRFSASPLYSPGGEITEFGIDPTPGFECHASSEELAQGHDAILNKAIEYLTDLHTKAP